LTILFPFKNNTKSWNKYLRTLFPSTVEILEEPEIVPQIGRKFVLKEAMKVAVGSPVNLGRWWPIWNGIMG